MVPIGSMIGGTAAIGAGIAGAKLQQQNIKDLQEQMQEIKAQKAESRAHRDAAMYAGETAEDMAAKANMREIMAESIQAANNNVVGSTPEAAALAKQQAAQQLGQMGQQQAVQRQARKDNAWTQGQQEQQQWQNYINSTRKDIAAARTAQAQAISQAASQVASSAKGISI
ncbi:MAG: hypothetical protein J6S52_02610 [Prevotella sp.]|nr:hypothetical protein [Prevotella sp.]